MSLASCKTLDNPKPRAVPPWRQATAVALGTQVARSSREQARNRAAPAPAAMGRTDPEARRKEAEEREAKRKAAPAKTSSKWSEEEDNEAKELYAQGGRDRAQFGTDLSAALKGSKTPSQCSRKYRALKEAEPETFYVFDFDKEDPTKHSAELIAALPEADRNLEEPEIERRWWAEVKNKGYDAARDFLSNVVDHAFNYFRNGEYPKDTKAHVQVLTKARLPPSFLKLNPPKRNTPVFRRACDQFRLQTLNVQRHRKAALGQLMGDPVPCSWGFLLPGEDRSDDALKLELAARAVLYTCLGDGANPATEMPTTREMPPIKKLVIMPPFEPVAPGATHATDPSYARREPA